MHTFSFLDEIVLLLAAALGVIMIFNRIKLPPIVGLMVTGLLLGPSGLSLVNEGSVITGVSEIGVILLLFTIGLEFSFDDIRRMRTVVFVAGPLQLIIGATAITFGAMFVASQTGVPLTTEGAVLIGMAMALSSTAICMKLLKDRRELKQPHGKMVTGILIFQDIAVVPMMLIVVLLSPKTNHTGWDLVQGIAIMIGVTVALILTLRYLVPRIVPVVTRTASPEALIIGGLALCLGTAWIADQAGISMALGAFIAGMTIGGSDDGHRFGRVLQPIRDVFTSMFFVSIGLLVTIDWSWIHITVLTALAILAVNTIVVLVVLVILRVNLRTAVIASIILAQVGEFSFILIKAGHDHGVLSAFDMQNLIVCIIFTMVVTPTLIRVAPWFAERTAPMVRRIRPVRQWYATGDRSVEGGESADYTEIPPLVLIVGAGVLGTNVAQVMDQTTIPYRVLEIDPLRVEDLRLKGCTVIEGDVTDHDALLRGGIRDAHAVVIAISDQMALAHGVEVVRRERPDVLIIARTRYALDTESVARKGADIVITEEYESSIQVFVTVLEYLGVPSDVIHQQEIDMRSNDYGVLTVLHKTRSERESDANTQLTPGKKDVKGV
jgi:monovalent cation:H+ antiporter-2, CPA2 family